MAESVKVQFKHRKDSASNWQAENPVLLDGELGIESGDLIQLKLGNGVSNWNDLPYLTVNNFSGYTKNEVDASLSEKANINGGNAFTGNQTIDSNKVAVETTLSIASALGLTVEQLNQLIALAKITTVSGNSVTISANLTSSSFNAQG